MAGAPCIYLSQAAEHWRNNEPLDAGRLIFENLPEVDRPVWAASILRFIVMRLGINLHAVAYVLDIAGHPQDWGKAHDAFYVVRDETLRLEALPNRSAEQELQLAHLFLTEVVAKVIYNSTEPSDEFDEDSGWWIAVCVRDIVDRVSDSRLANEVWLELIRRCTGP